MVDEFVKKEDFERLVSQFNDLVRVLNSCKLKKEIEFEEYYSEDDTEFMNFNFDKEASLISEEKKEVADEFKL